MVCPCGTQMQQLDGLGGGSLSANGKEYITWTIVKCPNCLRIVREFYKADEITEGSLALIRVQYKLANAPATSQGEDQNLD